MISSSPWGKVIEQKEWSKGIYSLVTALHSGMCLDSSNFEKLSSFAKDLAIKFQEQYFFAESGPASVICLETGIESASLQVLLSRVNEELPNYFLDEAGAKWLPKLSSIETEKYIEPENLITQIYPLDCGCKVSTYNEQEYLLSSYPSSKNLQEQEIIGSVTSFFSKDSKDVYAYQLPSVLLEKYNLSESDVVTLRPINVNYAYVLELSSLGGNNYLGEVDVCHYPSVLRVWNE